MRHHLKGYLAGLSVLVGVNEKPEVLSCLHQCKESLQVNIISQSCVMLLFESHFVLLKLPFIPVIKIN